MTISIKGDGVVALIGSCPVEDAEALLQHLLAAENPQVDWSGCERAHTAVIQVLLASGIVPNGEPTGAVVRDHVRGGLARAKASRAPVQVCVQGAVDQAGNDARTA